MPQGSMAVKLDLSHQDSISFTLLKNGNPIWSMYVSPKFRSQGVGAALLDEVLTHARKLGILRQIILGVTANNSAAISLYRSRGFERFGLERDALLVDGIYFDEEHLVLYFARVTSSLAKIGQ